MADVNKGLFKATPDGFVPWDERGRQLLRKMAHKDKPIFMTVRSARNPEFSAMAHVVFSLLADGLGVPMDAIKSYLKEQTGRFDVVKMPDGSVTRLRHSIAFSAMGEEDFRAFWTDALPVIYEKLLGGVPSETYQQIVDVLAGKRKDY